MKTFYEILKIKNDANDLEIEEAYAKLERKYQNNKAELNNIKIAKQILLNKEARANYDEKLKQLEANDIFAKIKNNTANYNNKLVEKENNTLYNEKLESENNIEKKDIEKSKTLNEIEEELNNKKRIDEKNRLKEEKRIKKIKEKQVKYQQQKYEEAYNNYLKSLGYNVKTPWTFERIKRLTITLVAIILVLFIMWQIPAIRNPLLDLYENNKIVNIIVNIIISIITSIWNGVTSLFKGGE